MEANLKRKLFANKIRNIERKCLYLSIINNLNLIDMAEMQKMTKDEALTKVAQGVG